MTFLHIKIKISTVVVFVVSIFIGANAIISTATNAQGIIGTSCEKAGERKEVCIGNTETVLYCSRPEGVANYCGYNYGVSGYCSFPKDAVEDQCADQFLNDVKTCIGNLNSCVAPCDDSYKSCRKSCQCDPDLGVMYQCSPDYDIKFSSCLDNCDAKEEACRLTCFEDKNSCVGSARDKYNQCDKARLIWKEVNAIDCGKKNQVCIEKADQYGDRADCVLSSEQPQIPSQAIPSTPPVENTPGPSPYAVCAIKCLDDVDARYQCPLPSPSVDDSGVSVIILPDGSTRNFSPRDNECVDDRGKTQSACLSQCPVTVGGEPIADPIGEGQKIKVAGAASNDPLNEAAKYMDLLRRRPDLPNTREDIKRTLGDYDAAKPVSVWDVEGEPEMQVPGSDEWVTIKKGDTIPPGARIFTGIDDDLFVRLPGAYIVKVRGLTDITFNQTGIPKAFSKGELINHLDLRTGDVEVHVERGTYQGTMQVRMPQYVAGVRGTHFWVSYDEAKRLGAVGVYEGEVAVDDLFRGTRTLLTPANDKTPRVIVIPSTDFASVQGQDIGAATPRPQTQEGSNSGVWWLVFALVLGSGVFILHKTGKLQPILQKVLALVHRDNSKPL